MRQENLKKLSRCYFVSMEPRYRVINLDSTPTWSMNMLCKLKGNKLTIAINLINLA